ncbi:hypothetical protein FHR32_000585 [Streptosporangium album]|uniref:Uncharacterized protein n=1 Tax=Streptosporangium album TaxID=47479 RepID=A0A7W7RQG7_9ACTN|nr:hypothetical protein [Streptosporangium album]MBB4936280.1 hypothetical protein [Streptosporangium album]
MIQGLHGCSDLRIRRKFPQYYRDPEQADEWQWVAFGLASEIAAAHGISPLALTRDTRARGTGVLALTPYATAHQV